MVNNYCPEHLRRLMPGTVNSRTRYPLRDSSNFNTPICHTNLYYTSFIPSQIRAWNNFPQELKDIHDKNSFIKALHSSVPVCNPLFSIGPRAESRWHAQLRMGRSQLNAHLHLQGLVESNLCQCGTGTEDVRHYLMSCPLYHVQRNILFDSFASFDIDISHRVLLEGADQLTFNQNKMLFSMVHTYIKSTGRFQNQNINAD